MNQAGGTLLILDFGVAKALSKDGGTLSISGELLGSPGCYPGNRFSRCFTDT